MDDRAISTTTGVAGAPGDGVDASREAGMRRLLDTMSELTAAEALSALRDAFPDAPLNERVQALKFSRH